MTTVGERLIESWLDSQTERRYQPAFIQLLVSSGWNVLHNTRHSPIEFGKDVIARDPNGVLHCFQLKGNPGSRVTKSEAQKLLPQVVELLEVPPPITFRLDETERYVAVFVTNGEIDEEARLLFEGAGERTKVGSCPASNFELWSRGMLLSEFLKAADTVWPTSLQGTRHVLEFIAQDGLQIPDSHSITKVLDSMVPAPTRKTSAAAKKANLASILLLAEILKSPWYSTENHYGLYVITVLTSVQALRFADSAKRLAMVAQYASLSLEHCADLITEAKARNFNPDQVWGQGEILSEFDIMWERRRLVGDCAATLVLSESAEIDFDQPYVQNLLEATFLRPGLWGFAAVPALIGRYWALDNLGTVATTDQSFGQHLHIILESSLGRLDGSSPLASPYYSFTDCWAHSSQLRFFADDGIFSDSFKRRVWFARAMLFMLAKRNWKQTCKELWSAFSLVIHEEADLPSTKFFGSLHSRDGQMRSYTFHRKEWVDLVGEAVEDREGAFLEPFSSLAWLLAAYVAIVPHRAWTGVLMWLDSKLNTTWFHRDHLPTP